MMVLAFFAGLVLVTLIFSGSPREQPEKKLEPAGTPNISPATAPVTQMVGLGEGYFVYRSPEDRFFLCRAEGGRLQVVDVYKLRRKEPTYHAGVSGKSSHGWSFESLSRGKEAVLEAKCNHFKNTVASQDWTKAEKLAQEIAAVGGTDFLKDWLEPKRDWGGRRAAALALAERGYVETVPALADMLLEGPEVRERAANLLVKLTGEDLCEGSKRQNQQNAIEKYKEWYLSHLEEKE
jgi:hypothetical protein